jgi:hypothetical protein
MADPKQTETLRSAAQASDILEHELSCRRCAYWTEAARELGGKRLGKIERDLLLAAGSVERRELKMQTALSSRQRNALARLRRKRLLGPRPRSAGFREGWPTEAVGPYDMPIEEVENLPPEVSEERARQVKLFGRRQERWLRPHLMRTGLGDAVVALYGQQLRDGTPIRLDVEALAQEIVKTCPDRRT